MKRLFVYIIVISLFSIITEAKEFSPREMPNVNVANRYEFVSDPAGLMPENVKAEVNRRLWDLRQKTSVEAVVALPPDIGEMPIEEWSEELFTDWGIGKKDKDNGVLLVIAPEQRQARIQTGYGVEGVLTDIACNNIIRKSVIPAMREDNIGAAVLGAVTLMSEALTDPAVADELRSSQGDNYSGSLNPISGEVIWGFIQIIAGCVFLFSLGFFIYNIVKTRKLDRYEKAIAWRNSLVTFGWCSLLSLGSGLVWLLIAFLMYRRTRTKPLKCSTCGAKMHRLPEDEDNELLSDSQDFEEKLNTVDYDVWECPKCGTIERFPYKTKQLKYTECPSCHTIAMGLECDRTIIPATEARPGKGEKIYKCKFCHHQKRVPYVIPKKESVAPLVAGAILGSMTGRGGGGGGFGGGFGGGSTGGGGATGSW